jgi:DNA-binding transcriptional regulator YdaS (Cro superfamily)
MQDKVIEFLDNNGIQKKYFANQIEVSPAVLSHWFAGRIALPAKKLNRMNEIINDYQ